MSNYPDDMNWKAHKKTYGLPTAEEEKSLETYSKLFEAVNNARKEAQKIPSPPLSETKLVDPEDVVGSLTNILKDINSSVESIGFQPFTVS